MEKHSQKSEIRRERTGCSENYHTRESYLQMMRAIMSDAEYTPQVQNDEKLDAYFLYEKQISNLVQTLLAHSAPQAI
ncbi:hypothetical protein U27_03222 [Candidatus Vecturithrix granuli]|uniref:Uncharacterized protein n=1 Tax=Vecturithrix granuli TaxID=1499967 RepID=A0A081BVA5_VECG1|nr:hypothetical protein U27_03222 [Candidatus Vecturithrix granuli]